MPLIVEDGSIVENANSYIDLEFARAYALARGVTLPADDTEAETLAFKAMDYIEGLRGDYQGDKTNPLEQELQFPRRNVKIDRCEIPSDSIPKTLKQAQARLMMESNEGVDFSPSRQGGFVIEDKTGPLTTKYSQMVGTGVRPTMTAVDDLLRPLFNGQGQGFGLRLIRK